ncbi:MAG: alpha/beta hydrolase [Anaerolineae bacterium]|jgi:fermentation-respiration switch protein FrsA (DUF1100 family)
MIFTPHWSARGRALAAVAGSLVIAGTAYVGLEAWSASDTVVHPERKPIDRSLSEFGISAEDVEFVTTDGLTLRGWFVPPSGANGAVVMTQPGYGGNRTSVITHTAMLVRHGYGVLTFDWRNLGESDGYQSTIGYEEQIDVAAATKWLLARPDIDRSRIGALGQSAGAAAMIVEAADDSTIRALVAETTFASLQDMMDASISQRTGLPAFPFAPLVTAFSEMRVHANISDLRPVDAIGRLAPRPVLLIRGGRDLWMPGYNADLLFAAAGEPKELWDAPEAEHAKVILTYPDEYERRVVGFFDKYLAGR